MKQVEELLEKNQKTLICRFFHGTVGLGLERKVSHESLFIH